MWFLARGSMLPVSRYILMYFETLEGRIRNILATSCIGIRDAISKASYRTAVSTATPGLKQRPAIFVDKILCYTALMYRYFEIPTHWDTNMISFDA